MVTMEDISIALGCSINTVSKALNNKPDVSPKTRQLVIETAKRMGYVPNSLAKSLVTKSSGTLGIVVPSVTVSIYTEIVEAIMQQTAKLHYSTFMAVSMGDPKTEVAAIENLYQKRTDGLIIIPVNKTPEYHKMLKLYEQPAVYILSDVAYEDACFVGFDLAECAGKVTKHLIDNGCRRIALLCSTRSGMTIDIEEGYRCCLEENGLEFSRDNIFKPDTLLAPQDAGFEIAHMLDARINEYDGIVLEHELLYFGLHQLLDEHGLSCPEDLLVAASIGTGVRQSRHLSLTSIDLDPVQIGEDSVTLLMDLIRRKKEIPETKIKSVPILTVRKSSKRP